MRKQKIISLTDDLYNEASKMENFSKWVRDRLEEHIQRTKTDDGRTMTYVCMKCCEDDGVEFQKGPTKDRLRGYRFPTTRPCPTCNGEAYRWDVA